MAGSLRNARQDRLGRLDLNLDWLLRHRVLEPETHSFKVAANGVFVPAVKVFW